MARVTATTDYEGFDAVDLVIEAVFEDLTLKRQVLAEVEQHTAKNAIFASNTASLPISQNRSARAPAGTGDWHALLCPRLQNALARGGGHGPHSAAGDCQRRRIRQASGQVGDRGS